MSKVKLFYDASKNPDGFALPGVPLRDVTEDEYEALPKHLRASAEASPMYRKTPLPAAKPAQAESKSKED